MATNIKRSCDETFFNVHGTQCFDDLSGLGFSVGASPVDHHAAMASKNKRVITGDLCHCVTVT